VNTTCSNSPVQDPIIVTQLPVILTCCVEGCPNWTGHWYRDTIYGTNRSISVGPTLSVKTLIKKRETFICIVSFDSHSDNPFCHDDQHNEGSITLIKCKSVTRYICVSLYMVLLNSRD